MGADDEGRAPFGRGCLEVEGATTNENIAGEESTDARRKGKAGHCARRQMGWQQSEGETNTLHCVLV